jgi:hypothetical protein
MSKDLNILQINLNRSPIATEAALELVTAQAEQGSRSYRTQVYRRKGVFTINCLN